MTALRYRVFARPYGVDPPVGHADWRLVWEQAYYLIDFAIDGAPGVAR